MAGPLLRAPTGTVSRPPSPTHLPPTPPWPCSHSRSSKASIGAQAEALLPKSQRGMDPEPKSAPASPHATPAPTPAPVPAPPHPWPPCLALSESRYPLPRPVLAHRPLALPLRIHRLPPHVLLGAQTGTTPSWAALRPQGTEASVPEHLTTIP